MANDNAIKGRVRELGAHDKVASAIAAVLALKPPTRHPADDAEDHAMATDGWLTCMAAVKRTLADTMEVR